MTLQSLLQPDAILAELGGRDAATIFAELCVPLARSEGIPQQELVAALLEREALATTAVGDGVAIPHGVHPRLQRVVASFGRAPAGVPFGAPDGQPVRLFVALLRPVEAAGAHLKALARVSQVLGRASVRDALLQAATAEKMYRILVESPGAR
jgi:PTS system nitrogen regulatory IIA component